MVLKPMLALAAMALSVSAAQAEDSAVILGKSTYAALCANCHGDDAKGGGQVAELYKVDLPDLTTLTQRAGGQFPFSSVYESIIEGMDSPAHGTALMPIWGDYFVAEALEDRGVNKSDAMDMAAGRALSVAYYIESIQE